MQWLLFEDGSLNLILWKVKGDQLTVLMLQQQIRLERNFMSIFFCFTHVTTVIVCWAVGATKTWMAFTQYCA